MDRLELRPKVVCTTDEEIDAELRRRINQQSKKRSLFLETEC
jgi:hypothetical protein